MRHRPLASDLPGPGWAPYLLIAAAVAAAYANAFGAGFQFDDWNVIVDEPRVSTVSAWWDSMPGMRPLLKLSYALNLTSGLGPAGFHAVNVAIHAVNACLVFALFARQGGRRLAVVAALLFAVHPVQTEAITYVSGRSTSLMALFALASIVAWIDGRRRVLSPALFAAALLVKETAFVVPLAIVLVDATSERKIRWPFGHLVVLAAAAVAALASPTYRHLLEVSLATRDVGSNLMTQANGVAYLAGQLVRFLSLNADPKLPVITSWSWTVGLEAAAILAALALGFALLRRKPVVAFGTLWFFLWLIPTNSFLPRLDVANDRQLYLALAGPAWLVAAGVTRINSRRYTAIAIALTLVLIVGLGIGTYARNRTYADEITYWEDVVRKSPGNARALNNLGYALALAGRRDEAENSFMRALRIDPNHFRAAVNLHLLREGALGKDPSSRTNAGP